jgi:hypothetical protein
VRWEEADREIDMASLSIGKKRDQVSLKTQKAGDRNSGKSPASGSKFVLMD